MEKAEKLNITKAEILQELSEYEETYLKKKAFYPDEAERRLKELRESINYKLKMNGVDFVARRSSEIKEKDIEDLNESIKQREISIAEKESEKKELLKELKKLLPGINGRTIEMIEKDIKELDVEIEHSKSLVKDHTHTKSILEGSFPHYKELMDIVVKNDLKRQEKVKKLKKGRWVARFIVLAATFIVGYFTTGNMKDHIDRYGKIILVVYFIPYCLFEFFFSKVRVALMKVKLSKNFKELQSHVKKKVVDRPF